MSNQSPWPEVREDLPTVVLIDGANCQAAFKQLGKRPDWKRISDWLNINFNIVHLNYYTAMLADSDGNIPIKSLVDWLGFNGYVTKTKMAKVYKDVNGTEKSKGNMDIEIAVDMVLAAQYAKQIFLFSGDADFVYAVREVQSRGVRVVAFSTLIDGIYPIIGDDLRKQCNGFVNLRLMSEFYMAEKKDEKVAAQ